MSDRGLNRKGRPKSPRHHTKHKHKLRDELSVTINLGVPRRYLPHNAVVLKWESFRTHFRNGTTHSDAYDAMVEHYTEDWPLENFSDAYNTHFYVGHLGKLYQISSTDPLELIELVRD